MSLSPLTISRNILDRLPKGLAIGGTINNVRATVKYPPIINTWMKSAQKIEDEMIRRGAVLGHGHLSEAAGTEGLKGIIAKPFASSEQGNQTYIALVKKLQLESDIKRLHQLQGRSGTVAAVYDRLAAIVGSSKSQTQKRVLQDVTNEQLATMMDEGRLDDAVLSEVLVSPR